MHSYIHLLMHRHSRACTAIGARERSNSWLPRFQGRKTQTVTVEWCGTAELAELVITLTLWHLVCIKMRREDGSKRSNCDAQPGRRARCCPPFGGASGHIEPLRSQAARASSAVPHHSTVTRSQMRSQAQMTCNACVCRTGKEAGALHVIFVWLTS